MARRISPRISVWRRHQIDGLGLPRCRSEDGSPRVLRPGSAAAQLFFAVAPECRELTGVNPLSTAAIERHADLVARLFLPE